MCRSRHCYCSVNEIELQFCKTNGQVQANLPLNRNRLKGDRPVRATDQNIGAKSHANGSLPCGAHIAACEFAGAKCRRSIDKPNNNPASSRAQIKAKLGNCTSVRLYRPGHRRSESTVKRRNFPASPW